MKITLHFVVMTCNTSENRKSHIHRCPETPMSQTFAQVMGYQPSLQ